MNELAQEVLLYFQTNSIPSVVIMPIAGFFGVKTVAWGKKTSPAYILLVGVLGWILGQFFILGLGLESVLNEISEFNYLFDFIAAYVGSFLLAALVHFLNPV